MDERVDVLLAALESEHMSVTRAAAAELITDRVQSLMSQLRIAEATARTYLDDDALAGLARTMVASLAEEQPGLDVLSAARSAVVSLPLLGRCIAGLAEAIHVQLAQNDDEAVRTRVRHLSQTLSMLGQLIAEADGSAPAPDTVAIPPAVLLRVARYLDNAADQVSAEGLLPAEFDPQHADQLAATFHRDAIRLRTIAQSATADS